MKSRPRKKRVRERSLVKELERLYARTADLVYRKGQHRDALVFAQRLNSLLDDSDLIDKKAIDGSVHGNEVRALIAEAHQDWGAAVRYRRKKIALLKRLRMSIRSGQSITADELAPPSYVSACYADLAIALRNAHRIRAARLAILEAERVSSLAGNRFEYSKLKRELLQANPDGGRRSSPKTRKVS